MLAGKGQGALCWRVFAPTFFLCYTQRMEDGLGPMERWGRVLASGNGLAEEVFHRLTDGENPETLDEIAKSMGVPRGELTRWFATEQVEWLDAAEKVLGVGVAHAVKKMTDDATNETLKLAKFKTDRYLRLAEVMNGERYSKKQEIKHSGLLPTLVIEIAGVGGVEGRREIDVTPVKPAQPVLADDGMI